MIDFRNPDYRPVFAQRIERLARLRSDAGLLNAVRTYYRDNVADFVNDWGVTFDPRNIEKGLPALVPFILFDRQRECFAYMYERWQSSEPALIEKSRDVGLSWIVVAFGASMCIFREGFVAGFGSRKEEYVDKLDAPRSLFYKARLFMKYLPPEFRAGWNERKHAPHMRIMFPATGSVMVGEAGDGIGRGDRTSWYAVDESAFLERPQLVDASLSATTNARCDLSSVNGRDNPFAVKRWGGKIKIFIFDWRDDPRKDAAWYAKQCEILDPVVVAQEIDRSYDASKEGIVIPSEWVQSAIDAHLVLGIAPSGKRNGALDVADEGRDKNAFAHTYGILLEGVEEWSGKDSDIFETTNRAFLLCDQLGLTEFDYDADGLGAGVRGDARVLNQHRKAEGRRLIEANAYRGSGEVIDPERPIPSATRSTAVDKQQRTNKDFFANRKAQAWWSARVRFQITHRAVQAAKKGETYDFDPDAIISIPSTLPARAKLTGELSQPTWSSNNAGKILIDKAPDGSMSPNLADAVIIAMAPQPRRGGFLSQ